MSMEPYIDIVPGKQLVGMRTTMSYSADTTVDLWQRFMPRRKAIPRVVGSDLYSVEVYPQSFFSSFRADLPFEKWAAVEVADVISVPNEMEPLPIPAGLYAVFIHRGPASEGPATFRYIFGTWLPQSDYVVDDRPHFAVMGESYRPDDPDSEEELFIPVAPRSSG